MHRNVSPAVTDPNVPRILEELRRELTEARAQQAATSEILHVISNSPADAHRVFQELAVSAARLCDAYDAGVLRLAGDHLRVVGHYGSIPLLGPIGQATLPLTRGVLIGRAVLDRKTLQVADLQAETDEYPEGSELARRLGHRTILAVPLIRAGEAIGAIYIRRTEVRLFTDRQIDLLKMFADQAVIAIENVRLFEEIDARTREVTESLKYQTATSEVLSVISRSTFDVQPVLEAVIESATKLCGATRGHIFQFDGEFLRFAAAYGAWPGFTDYLEKHPLRLGRGSLAGTAASERRTVHALDVLAVRDYQHGELVQQQPYRTALAVPMLREDAVLGVICVLKSKMEAFTDRQIKLVETFADQAVIAIENARLFEEVQARTRELTQALEQQTATSEVLGVISSSPGKLEPVFQTMLANAVRLCAAKFGTLWLAEGDDHFRSAAMYDLPPALAEARRREPVVKFAPETGLGRVVKTKQVVHVADMSQDPSYLAGNPRAVLLVDLGGARTVMFAPMIKDDEVIGSLTIYRQEVHPFTDKQIALVSNFAAQAVIAIENVRLLNELRESLQQQTATADVLKVISRSPTQVAPVFDAIVESAAELCGATFSNIQLYDGRNLSVVATHNYNPEVRVLFERMYPMPPGRTQTAGRAILSRSIVHVPDIFLDPEYSQEMAQAGGFRSTLSVPMLRDGDPVGVISVALPHPTPFSERQIDLLRTFADQAVIAIENARLFDEVQARTRELTEALKQQTATADVLKVISRSAFDLHKVLDTLVESAARLCEADHGWLFRRSGDTYRWAASFGHSHDDYERLKQYMLDRPISPGRGTLIGRTALEGKPVHIPDVLADPEYTWQEGQKVGKYRSVFAVPLLRDGKTIGVLALSRFAVRQFNANQIELATTFADQAVIAIENARLLSDLQERQGELARSVEELKSLGEVSQAINSSLELDKVLPTILEHACVMSYAGGGTMYVFDKASGEFHLAVGYKMSQEHIAIIRSQPIHLGTVVVGQCAERRSAVQIADLETVPPSPVVDILRRTGVRAVLAVPLLHQGEVVGALVVRRNHPGAFSAETIRLLEAFAAQSAIAVHNARLFEEIAQKSRELEIASQHKSQFVANMSHELRTPLAAILGYAELMQEGFYEPQGPKALDALTRIRSNGKHLLGLINTVLDIAKIESGQFSLNMAEYAMDNVVETVRVATESLAQNKKLAFKTEVAKSLPIGLGDEQRLTQVLLNLVGNAIKFTDTGEVRVTATAVNGHFAVGVTDTGPGIPVVEQKRVFEQFHQVDNTNTKAKGGTGLGLAIAKQIVEMHGGRIWVESVPGRGATFQMEFPVRAEKRKGAT